MDQKLHSAVRGTRREGSVSAGAFIAVAPRPLVLEMKVNHSELSLIIFYPKKVDKLSIQQLQQQPKVRSTQAPPGPVATGPLGPVGPSGPCRPDPGPRTAEKPQITHLVDQFQFLHLQFLF